MRIIDYIDQGGAIMYILLIFNIIGFAILGWKVLAIISFKKESNNLLIKIKENFSDITDKQTKLSLVKDEISASVHSLEGGLNTVKIIASVSPLLGLLGTVVGILSAFQVIADKGLSDPSLFAGGIAMALVTTVGGLVVAIPHFIGYNYLVSSLDDIEMKLEKEASSILKA
ncbi:MAG: MotA/TolQ/ExbB proton channel family protein [Bacteriovoracaceae bacterium]|jgi:biopolymer transport protein ExbB|nr:MotA/TolQ/ExbB proton channel family protein [Bacteriovoracaceae bacterium]